MENILEEIFGSLEPAELDELTPNGFKYKSKMPRGALARIENTVFERTGLITKKRRVRRRLWIPAAACLAISASVTGVACAAEAREYGAAVDFFEENGLCAEGLSRKELKAVYRDITTNRFTNDKTAEVIRRSVPGTEILQADPTPEELSTLWNSNIWNSPQPRAGIQYRREDKYKPDEELGFDVFDKSIVECYRDGVSLWKTEISSFRVESCVPVSAGTAVMGSTIRWSTKQPKPAWLARLDDSGNILWYRRLDHGFKYEYIAEIFDNGDGTWSVISRGENNYLCLSKYDINGSELSFTKTDVGNKGIGNTARLGDGYLVQLASYIDRDYARIVKLDKDGNITENFVYESEDCDYRITNMVEFENKVYLSAYAVPKRQDTGGEIAGILDYIYGRNDDLELSSEELTPIVRENYTAVLLVCDPDGGEPKKFYSVKGSLGSKLSVEDGQLKWDVNSVTSTYFSPYTSSFRIGGTCKVFTYGFDGTGALVRRDDTGETIPFRRL